MNAVLGRCRVPQRVARDRNELRRILLVGPTEGVGPAGDELLDEALLHENWYDTHSTVYRTSRAKRKVAYPFYAAAAPNGLRFAKRLDQVGLDVLLGLEIVDGHERVIRSERIRAERRLRVRLPRLRCG